MKCICITQPWAWAILAGLENVEYRCHRTDYRGDLLIYASSHVGYWDRRQLDLYGADAPRWEELPLGMVVGLVELWACNRGKQGEWAWILRNPRFIEPILTRPGKGLFEVSSRQIRVLPPAPPTRCGRSNGAGR